MQRRFLLFLALASCAPRQPAAPAVPIVWAWERAEDLRFLPTGTEVAVHSGFIEIGGDTLVARGRRFPLRIGALPTTSVVHIQIDHRRPLAWTPTLRREVVAATLHYATRIPAPRVQIDFEVRASERSVLLEVLHDVRRGLPRGARLSMTALASWCDGERWLDAVPVDEIVPMLFRMGRSDEIIRKRLAEGGDFRHPRCRSALAIATDTPIVRAPPGRRVYLFDPRSWTGSDFEGVKRQMEGWR